VAGLRLRVLPGPPIFACGASCGTAGHPVSRALDIADRAYVLGQGGVVYHAAAHELLADNDIKERCCSV
jgi:ABC-type transporter Mla maintaining outer membrane lipid asymmetry ATPase subunit MlaF